jgi:hypothetical protein
MPGTWSTVEEPILEAIKSLEADDPGTDEIIGATGLSKGEVQTGLRRLLQADYITGIDVTTMSSGFELIRIQLLERGLRITGEWPADAYDEFVAAVQDAIAKEPNPDERTKLERLRDAAAGVGRDVATTLIVDALKRAAGI